MLTMHLAVAMLASTTALPPARADVAAAPVAFIDGDAAADINGDGVIDIRDVVEFIRCFVQRRDCADINGDGQITIDDIFAFVQA